MGMRHRHRSRLTDKEEEYLRQTNDRELATRLLNYTWRMRRQVLFLGLIVLATTILNLIPPYLFSLAIDRYIANLDVNGLALLAMAFVGFIIITILAGYGHNYLISWLGAKLEYNMRMDLFQHLQTLSPGYFAKREVGNIISRVTNDVEKITELVSSGVVEALANMVTLVGIIAIMLWMSPWLSMISFSVIPLIVIFIYFWGRRVRTIYRQTRKTIASVSAKIEESVSGMKEIQSFSREQMTPGYCDAPFSNPSLIAFR
ncbi:unnamed protein product [marine sediment metagenome]|uniref:ABC transmembrane type-1 domain-containing protein n=1 Tax=marine sediment metagenome TaxID=412755 RepID=X0YQU2_9ZZZZ